MELIQEISLDQILERLTATAQHFDAEKEIYFTSYPYFISYFRSIEEIKIENLIIGISFTYSWMPTILKKLEKNNFDKAVLITNRAKNNGELNHEDFTILKKTLNNSLVGSSKLLHFINPDKYAIWDSKVARFLKIKKVEDINNYIKYLGLLENLKSNANFPSFYTLVESKLGKVSASRAIELMMFKSL
jgi:hypothetical protein